MNDTAGSSTAAPTGSRHRRARRWVLPACLAAVAAVLVGGGTLIGQPASQPSVTASPPAVSSTASVGPVASPSVAATAPSKPVSITIPAIAVRSDLVGLGMEEDRTVEVPQDAAQAGWYDLGTIPGQPGSAVILGHVDSLEGPAVFFRLRELVPGTRVQVTLRDGTVETFEVARVETTHNDDFPAQRIYAGTPRRPTLALVTCGGDYDKDLGGYQSNVIAYAEHVGTQAP